jgi:hypothetical protein
VIENHLPVTPVKYSKFPSHFTCKMPVHKRATYIVFQDPKTGMGAFHRRTQRGEFQDAAESTRLLVDRPVVNQSAPVVPHRAPTEQIAAAPVLPPAPAVPAASDPVDFDFWVNQGESFDEFGMF